MNFPDKKNDEFPELLGIRVKKILDTKIKKGQSLTATYCESVKFHDIRTLRSSNRT